MKSIVFRRIALHGVRGSLVLACIGTMLLPATAFAALPFTCQASGDSWTVTGSPSRTMTCSLRCLVRDAAGQQDSMNCTVTAGPGDPKEPVCQGFLIGRKWVSATLVSGECANAKHNADQ